MMTNGLWRFFGGTLVAASLVTACGSSGDDEELPSATGGSAGATAGKGGSAGSTGGASGEGGTGGSTGGTAGTAGKGGSAGSAGGTGGTAGKGGSGGSTGGTAGTAGTAGKGGSGGSTGGTGGKGGSGGSTGGTGGSTGGTAGTAGKGGSGGSTAGSGGSTAGSGGSTAGSGGSTAGSGGSTAGSGGSTAGSGGSTAGSGGSTAGSGGSAGDAGAGGATGGAAGVGGCGTFGCPGGNGGGGSAGAGGGQQCNATDPSVDADGDGFFPPADCNDCDPNVNPGAIDIVNVDGTGNPVPNDQQVDEDCSGAPLLPGDSTTCDSGLAIDSIDGFDAAKAIELCQKSDGKTWGVISADYLLMDGKPIPNNKASHLAHGILDGWGTSAASAPKLGTKLLVLSSGVARDFGDPDHQTSNTASHGSPNVADDTGGHLPGFPLQTGDASCGKSGVLHDSIELRLQLKAPTNAKSFSYSFKFYTHEFPQYICSVFNDMFVAVMSPAPVGAVFGNISFDQKGKALSVNGGFLDVCNPADIPANFQGTCGAGIAELAGTGLAAGEATTTNHAGTTWLQTTAPVDPGSTFTLTYAISDSTDGALDSFVVVDGFQWSANPGSVQTGNACTLGGTESCGLCLKTATNSGGCCAAQEANCGSGSACDQYQSCIGACAGAQACIDFCDAMYAAGKPDFEARQQCLYANVLPPDPAKPSKGACGVSCGVQTP